MGWEFSCPTLILLIRPVSRLAWANENLGSSGAVIPAAGNFHRALQFDRGSLSASIVRQTTIAL